MALEKITQITGRGVYISGDDIDTDRIIPARFLKCITFDDLAEGLFADVRFDQEGNKQEHPLNDPRFEGASVMLVGRNFGSGSSREHAPQSIYRAVLKLSLARVLPKFSLVILRPWECLV